MQILKIAQREYVSTRKEPAALDYSAKALSGLGYHYCTFDKGKYSLEELADILVKKMSTVIFYIPRTNSLAIVFAHSDRATKFIDIKEKTPQQIAAILRWFAICCSSGNEIVIANNLPQEIISVAVSLDITCRFVEHKELLRHASDSKKMLSAFKRTAIRAFVFMFIGLGFLSEVPAGYLFEKFEEDSLELQRELSITKRNLLEKERARASIFSAVKNKDTKTQVLFYKQTFADDFINLTQAPKSIIVKDGKLSE